MPRKRPLKTRLDEAKEKVDRLELETKILELREKIKRKQRR